MSGSTAIGVSEAGAATVQAPVRAEAASVPEGEIIILQLKPHLLFIVLSILAPLTICAVSSAFLYWVSAQQVQILRGPVLSFPDLGRLWVVPLVIAMFAIVWQTLEWKMRSYLLTDRRVVRVSGVFRQLVVEVPLPRVQQVLMYRSLRERIFGLGTPGLSSAASGSLSFVFWNMISKPTERLRVLRETIEKYGGAGHHGGAGVAPKGGA